MAPTSVYAGPDDMADGRITDVLVAARLATAAVELAALLDVSRVIGAGAAA